MFHLRFTPDDISGYTFNFLDQYDRYIVAQEDKDKTGKSVPLHYHIYIETDYGSKTIRDAIKDNLRIPTSGRGKNNKYYSLIADWKDIDYIVKQNNVIKTKGFTEKEIIDRVISGKSKYLRQEGEVELSGTNSPATLPKAKRISYDKEIIADLVFYYHDYKNKTGSQPSTHDLIKECCRIVRSYGKGISIFKVREYIHSCWYDTEDNRDFLVNKIFGIV